MSDEIRAALQKLDPKNDAHWTEDGLPALAALGFKKVPNRADVTNAAPKFTRLVQDVSAASATPPADPDAAKADVVDTGPPVDEQAEIDALQAKINEAQGEVDAQSAVVNTAKAKLEAAQNAHRVLVTKLENTAHKRHDRENMAGIQRVLETHKQERARAGQFAADLRSTGIKPEMFGGKAKIDDVMARRRGHGMNRPNFTARG